MYWLSSVQPCIDMFDRKSHTGGAWSLFLAPVMSWQIGEEKRFDNAHPQFQIPHRQMYTCPLMLTLLSVYPCVWWCSCLPPCPALTVSALSTGTMSCLSHCSHAQPRVWQGAGNWRCLLKAGGLCPALCAELWDISAGKRAERHSKKHQVLEIRQALEHLDG